MNFDADAISNMATKAKTATLQVDMLDYTEGYPPSFFAKAKRNSPQFFRHENFRHILTTIHKYFHSDLACHKQGVGAAATALKIFHSTE